MSRVSLIEQLYANKKRNALEFNWDALWAPPIRSILTQEDINELYRIATSLRYNADVERKLELIDSVMKTRGFKRTHCGTNRAVYSFLEIPTFVAKVAFDKVGLADSPAEFHNQEYFKPFCCKIFEVDPTGVISFIERVNPITSLEEFLSVSDDIFNMTLTKIIGKYVIDDLGTEKFMNYGLRHNSNGTTFGPVILDFPYAFELDGRKLICNAPIETPMGVVRCGGDVDYDDGLNHLICIKCKKKYKAMDLKKDDGNILLMYDDKGGHYTMRSRIVCNGKVIMDSGIKSNTYMTKDQFESLPKFESGEEKEYHRVSKTKKIHYEKIEDFKKSYYTSLQAEQYNKMQKMKAEKEKNQEKSSVSITSSEPVTISVKKDSYCDLSGYEFVTIKNHDNDSEVAETVVEEVINTEPIKEESVSNDDNRDAVDTIIDEIIEDSIKNAEDTTEDQNENSDTEETTTIEPETSKKESIYFNRSNYTKWTDSKVQQNNDPPVQYSASDYEAYKNQEREKRRQKFNTDAAKNKEKKKKYGDMEGY